MYNILLTCPPMINRITEYTDLIKKYNFEINENFSKNIINAGINATSQLNAIKKFIELNKINKTIFLTPDPCNSIVA